MEWRLVSSFHSKCDGHGDTLTVYNGNGHIFGGYAKPKWNSNGGCIDDNTMSSFIFTCRSQTKHSLTTSEMPIYGNSSNEWTYIWETL